MTKTSPVPKRDKAGRITLTVTFTKAQVKPVEEKVLKKLGAAVKIEGFRPGKAPAEMLKGKVSPDRLLEEIIRALLPETINRLAKEHELKPIIPPKVEAKRRDPLTLSLTFVEYPEISVKGAEKIKIGKKEPKVDGRDIEKTIDYILEQHIKTKEVERGSKEGDRVTMDFYGEDKDKKEIEGTRTAGHRVIIGSESLIPGFEDELKGLKKGATKSFTLKFPDKYHAAHLQGKPVTFHVTISKIEEVDKPKLTDVFAQEHLGAESADAFRKRVRESMEEQEKRVDRQRRESELFEKIKDATKVELAPELLEEEVRDLFENFAKQLKEKNIELNGWLKKTGKRPEDIEAEFDAQAKDRLTLRLGIQYLVNKKEIDPEDKEVEKAIADFLSPLSGDERSRIEPMYRKGMQGWEQTKWQQKVERLIDLMLE